MRRNLVVLSICSLCVSLSHATLIVHYDASDGASVLNTSAAPAGNGEEVGTWQDLAGAPLNAAPTSAGNPLYNTTGGPLGQPVIDFPGTVARNLVTSGATPARTVMLVHRWGPDMVGIGSYLIDARNGLANSFVWGGSIGPNWTAYVNDSVTPTGAIADIRSDTWQVTALVGTSTGVDDLHFFSRFSDNEFGLGSLAEVRIFDTALTESERLVQVAELDTKWFTAIPEPSSMTLALLGLLTLRRVGSRVPCRNEVKHHGIGSRT